MSRLQAGFVLSKLLHLCLFISSSIIFYTPTCFAQKVVLTAQYNSDGTPKPEFTSNTWQIDGIKGSFVYILFQHNEIITDEKLYLFVDKKVESKFEEYDTKKIFIHRQRTWSAIQYTFLQAGEYQVSIADAEKNILASTVVHINYKTNVYFSNDVDKNNLPLTHTKEFKLHQNPLAIYIFVKDTKPFASSSLKINIAYRTNENEYEAHVEEIFPIDSSWRFSFFEQSFSQKGKYRVTISKDNDEVLGIGFFEIT